MSESFEDAMAFAREVVADCDAPILDRLQKAHDHEMEQLRRSRFREGYVAGQRSMDAEHYAVALRLKHLPLDEDSHGNLSQIARAIWHSDFGWTRGACEALRDELVRLLGGVHDEPAPIPASDGACDADCDCSHGDETEVSEPFPNFSRTFAEPNLPKSAETSKPESDGGGESTITDELRKFKGHINGGLTPEMVLALRAEVNYIADRIDERVKHDRESDRLRIEKLVEQRDEARQECADLLDLLRDAVVDFEYASYSWNYALIVGENITLETERNRLLKECADLRKSLREIAERVGVPHDVDLDEYGDDLVAKATLGKIDSTHEYIGALEWQRDRQRKLLDEYDQTHMKLPVDANGESVHVGDIMEYAEGGKPKEVIAVSDTEAFLVDDGPRYSSLCVHHAPVDTAESIVRDIHLGKVTDSQAVERIRALR